MQGLMMDWQLTLPSLLDRARVQHARREIVSREATLAAKDVTPEAVARALSDFDPLWEVLTAPERERVLGLLIERIEYSGATSEIEITLRADGLVSLGDGPEAAP